MRNLACLLVALTMCACTTTPESGGRPIAADAREGEFSLEPYQWEGKIADGESVRISNAFGDLRVRAAVDGQLLISAAIQRFGGDDRDILISSEKTGTGVQVSMADVARPVGQAQPDTERGSNERFDGRVDLALLLPHAAGLAAETVDGRLEVKGYNGPAILATDSGRIVARTAAAVTARSDSGDLEVRFTATDWTGPSTVTSRTGSVRIILPRKSNLVIEASAGGELSASLGIPVAVQGKRLNTTLGNGSARLVVESVHGDVVLEREQVGNP